MNVVKITIVTLALIYLAVLIAMFLFQRHLQYFPSRQNPQPSQMGLTDVTVERLKTRDQEEIIVWYTPAQVQEPTLLFLHGNAGEIAGRAELMATYQAEGYGAAFVSWRGYGGSSGAPTEAGLMDDATSTLGWLADQGIDLKDVVVIGESLGSGIAVQLAAQHEIGAVILAAPFDAAVHIAQRRYPFLPVKLLMKDQFRSIDHVGDITAPIMILHGTQDAIIPLASGKKLAAAASRPVRFETLDGVGHDVLYGPKAWPLKTSFIESIFDRD